MADKTIPQLTEVATIDGNTSFLVVDNGIQTYKIKPVNIPGLPRTPIVDLEVDVIGATLDDVLFAKGFAYADKNGVWKLNLSMSILLNATTVDEFSVYITGVSIPGSLRQALTVNTDGANISPFWANAYTGSIRVFRDPSGSSDYSRINISGEIFLDEAPSFVDPMEFRNADGFNNRDAGLVTSVNGQIGDVVLNTSDIAEGSRKYYTDARARAGAVSDTLTPGVTDIAPSQSAVVISINSRQALSQKNQNNGYAGLDGSGKLFSSQLPTSILGSLVYKGTWNAASGVYPTGPSQGWYYVANTAGVISGVSYAIQDWMIYNGSSWDKLAGTEAITSVNNQTGSVVLDTDDISEGTTNKYFTDALARGAAVANAINDGETAIAPSQNVVFDALALKADAASTASAIDAKLDMVGGEASELKIVDYLTFRETTTPPTPAADEIAFYPKADGKFYMIGDDGVEKQAGGSSSGSGEINLITGSSDSTGWTGTATIATDVTPANFPLQGAIPTAIKISSASSGQYREFVFSVPAALAKKMKLELWFKHAGNATDWKIELYKNGVEVPLKTDVSGQSYLPAGTGRWATDTDFVVDSYALRIVRAASGAQDLYVQAVVVGPGQLGQVPAVGNWETFTPIGSLTTNVTYSGRKKRDTDTLKVNASIAFTGANTQGQVTLTHPDSLTLNTSLQPLDTGKIVGRLTLRDASGATFNVGRVALHTSTTVRAVFDSLVAASAGSLIAGNFIDTSSGTPIVFASGDLLTFEYEIPVNEWAGSGVLIGPSSEPQFAADDGTNDVFGPNGALVPNVAGSTGTTNRDVVFSTPQDTTGQIILELNAGGAGWSETPLYPFLNFASSYSFGVTGFWLNSTTYRVIFGNAGTTPNNGVGAFGSQTWALRFAAGDRFRVRKASSAAAIGIEPATANSSGLVSREYSTSFATTVTGGTTSPAITVKLDRVGSLVTMTVTAMGGTITKNGSNGQLTFATAIPAEFRPAANRVLPGYGEVTTVSQMVLWSVNTGGTVSMAKTMGGNVFTAGDTGIGWTLPITLTWSVS